MCSKKYKNLWQLPGNRLLNWRGMTHVNKKLQHGALYLWSFLGTYTSCSTASAILSTKSKSLSHLSFLHPAICYRKVSIFGHFAVADSWIVLSCSCIAEYAGCMKFYLASKKPNFYAVFDCYLWVAVVLYCSNLSEI